MSDGDSNNKVSPQKNRAIQQRLYGFKSVLGLCKSWGKIILPHIIHLSILKN